MVSGGVVAGLSKRKSQYWTATAPFDATLGWR